MFSTPPSQISIFAFVAALIALALALPAGASAANFTFSVNTTSGAGEGEVECTIKEPGEEEATEEEICDGTYPANTRITVLPSYQEVEGSKFARFENGTGSAAGCTKTTCSFKLTTNSSVDAIFDLEEFTLTIEKQGTGKGTVKCSTGGPFIPCAPKYPYETEVTLFAEAEEGSEFIGWSEACGFFEEEECELTVEEPLGVTATFNLWPQLKIEEPGTGTGTVQCEAEAGLEPCKARYSKETELALLAEPDPASEFAGWSGDCETVIGNKCELTMEGPRSVTATFDQIPSQKLLKVVKSSTGSGSGTVTSSPSGIECGATCQASFTEGEEVTLTAVSGADTKTVAWEGCASEPSPTKCQVTMSVAKTVKAKFALEQHLLTMTKSGTGAGTVTSTPAGISCGATCSASFDHGKEVTLTAVSGADTKTVAWEGCASEPSPTKCKVTMSAANSVNANFDLTAKPPPTCATDPSLCPPPAEGTAKASASAPLSGGKAALRLTCSGGACKGTLKLTAKVKQGKKIKNVVIGKASFSLAAGAYATLKVRLSGAARRELGKGKTLKAKLSGTGIAGSTVMIKPDLLQSGHQRKEVVLT